MLLSEFDFLDSDPKVQNHQRSLSHLKKMRTKMEVAREIQAAMHNSQEIKSAMIQATQVMELTTLKEAVTILMLNVMIWHRRKTEPR